MSQPSSKKLSILFWLLAIADVIGLLTNLQTLHYIIKPLLIPVLMLLLYLTASNVPGKKILLWGLFFSWLGDIFLLLETQNSLFFIAGLLCFLTTHILYILYFLKIRSGAVSLLTTRPLLIAIVALYSITLVWQLFPRLGDLKIPVIVYSIVISVMLLCSLHVFNKINKIAAYYFITGAVCFVLSDSLLAINKFYQPFPLAGVAIMITYCAAQYFIISGYCKQQV